MRCGYRFRRQRRVARGRAGRAGLRPPARLRAPPRRVRWLPVSFFMCPTQAADGAPHRRLAQLLALMLRPPGAVLQHRGIRCRFQPRPQHCLQLGSNTARVARNGLALQRARLALLHHGAFDRIYRDVKAASGFSHGLTLSHRSHQALFQVGRIGSHIPLSYPTCACHCFSQVALMPPKLARRR